MTKNEIAQLRDKIGTDPILTDEEIEYIWMAMDKQEVEHPIREKLQDGSRWYKCQVCGQVWQGEQEYCHYCGQKQMEDQMETKLRNLVRYIVSVSDKTRPKKGTDSSDFGEFEYKEVKINLPLEVIEELREWTK